MDAADATRHAAGHGAGAEAVRLIVQGRRAVRLATISIILLVFAGLIAMFIIIATAATLYPKGILVTSANDAAQALEHDLVVGEHHGDEHGVGPERRAQSVSHVDAPFEVRSQVDRLSHGVHLGARIDGPVELCEQAMGFVPDTIRQRLFLSQHEETIRARSS